MKLKTHKAAAKRLHITKRGKIIKRAAGQDHFNARERGITTMNKRRDLSLAKELTKTAKRLMPYN